MEMYVYIGLPGQAPRTILVDKQGEDSYLQQLESGEVAIESPDCAEYHISQDGLNLIKPQLPSLRDQLLKQVSIREIRLIAQFRSNNSLVLEINQFAASLKNTIWVSQTLQSLQSLNIEAGWPEE